MLGVFYEAVLFFFILAIAMYILISFVYMSLAKKAGQDSPGIAWIPGFGPLIIAFKSSGMHWWPWLLLIGSIIPLVGIITILIFAVYSFIWTWKLFEAVGRPGWWSLLMMIPVVGIVMICLAAWSDVGLEKKA